VDALINNAKDPVSEQERQAMIKDAQSTIFKKKPVKQHTDRYWDLRSGIVYNQKPSDMQYSHDSISLDHNYLLLSEYRQNSNAGAIKSIVKAAKSLTKDTAGNGYAKVLAKHAAGILELANIANDEYSAINRVNDYVTKLV